MKILLIQPYLSRRRIQIHPPLGITHLASCLELEGHNVRIIDCLAINGKIEDIEKEFKNFKPDIVGISSSTVQIYYVYSIFSLVKRFNPNCLTVIGGPHPSILPRETLSECKYIDVVVRGEGELTFVDLINTFEKKGPDGFCDVRGISFRNEEKIIENRERGLIEDLDSLPLPAYHLLPMKKYIGKYVTSPTNNSKVSYNYCNISTSRGCPYNCIFCASNALWGKKLRKKSAERIIEEINLLKEYNVKIINFTDDTFPIDKKRTKKICELIQKEDIDIFWNCITRVELFNKEMASLFNKSRCCGVEFGIESGVQQTLDFLNKGFTVKDSITAVKNAKKYDLRTDSNFIIGVPGETKEMINKTINFSNYLNLDYTDFTLLTPLPGTKLYNIAKEQNLFITEDWSKYTFFTPVMKVPGLSSFDLKYFLFKAYFNNQFNQLKNKLKVN